MATATVARPGQSLRNRRDAPRPTLSKRTATTMNGTTDGSNATKKRKLTEPYFRDSDFILRKHKGKQPSLTLYLYPGYFKFEGQDGSFAYDSPMKFILEHLKKQTVPHRMMEELLQSNVTFYDGCLIVEVHNHRSVGKGKSRNDSGVDGDSVKFSMHNYNPHVTPSPHVPYPKRAKEDLAPVKTEGEMVAPERPKEKEKEKDGPKITTIVLHPTELTKHEELKILANTPASEVRSKKRGNDSGTPSSAQPPTPSVSMPPTPVGPGPKTAGSQKMCLEEGDFYTFQADMLMATTEPLYLEPCATAQESDAIIDLLQHPNHQDKPPSPKTRKRTTAEVAADDAQAAEIERRMLIMDERIKATGTGGTAGEAQGAANAMPFQRFKTIDMVRQKHEEAERAKKEEETRKAMEKKEAEEQHAAQQKMMMAQRQMMAGQQGNNSQQQQPTQQQQQQMIMQQRRAAQAHAQAQQAQAQQQALMNAQNHAHPQQGQMMQNQQQNFNQGNQTSMAQSSPVVRQQTPMMNNSSPMMPQGGFPMAQTSSQGPGSPPRPTSAMQHPMARQMSQQQRGSQGANTPQLAQGTPSMGQAAPNRQMNQTPRMNPGSPAGHMQRQGTPVSGAMQTPGLPHQHQNQLTPHQMQMLEQRQMAHGNQNMMPDQIQNISNMQRQQHQQNMQQQMQRNAMMAAAQGNPQQMAALQQQQRQRQMLMQQQQQQHMRNQQMMAQQQGQQMGGHAGSPGGMGGNPNMQQTPQMGGGHGHPQQNPQHQQQNQHQSQTPQQQQQNAQQYQQRAQQAANAQLMQAVQSLAQQYGNLQNIPQQAMQSQPQAVQNFIRSHLYKQQQQQRQQQMIRAQQQQRGGQMTPGGGGGGGGGNGGGGGEQVPGGPGDPQYMAALRNQQQQMLSQIQGGGMNGAQGMSFQMGGNPGQGQGGGQFGGNGQGGGGQGGDTLTQQFQAMQRALNHNGQ